MKLVSPGNKNRSPGNIAIRIGNINYHNPPSKKEERYQPNRKNKKDRKK